MGMINKFNFFKLNFFFYNQPIKSYMVDLTKGTLLKFKEPVYTGEYPNGKFSHMREVIGVIVNDSYGSKKAQHTFTIKVQSTSDNSIKEGEQILRKGRTIYKECKVLEYPKYHKYFADEKHKRKKIVKKSIEDLKNSNQFEIKF